MTGRVLCLLCVATFLVAFTHQAQAATVEPLDFWPNGLSADGSIVVGSGRSSSTSLPGEAIRWTRDEGAVGLGYLQPGDTAGSGATGISADGSIIVGASWTDDRSEWFIWNAETGMTDASMWIWGISGDGSTLVGVHQGQAFRWTAEEGRVGLGSLPGHGRSEPYSVSDDGSVIVGNSGSEAFRWTVDEGMTRLLDQFGDAVDLSADGSVVVGMSWGSAFRWTADAGTTRLGWLGPYPDYFGGGSVAAAVSADGSVVVGRDQAWAHYPPGPIDTMSPVRAWIWDETNGMRGIEDLLTDDYGLDLTGWELTSATDISADGRAIIGYGRLEGVPQGWIAVIPEPSTLILLLAALSFGAIGWWRRGRRA